MRREFSVLAEGRHVFGRRPGQKPETALEKSLEPRVVRDAFLYISWPSLHYYDVKLPNVTFYVERELKTTVFVFFFLSQNQTIRILLQKNWSTYHKLNEMEY